MKIISTRKYEQTLMLIHTNAVQCSIVGLIMSEIERQGGIKLRGLNLRYVSNSFFEEHISNLDVIDEQMAAAKNSGATTSAPVAAVVAILWEGVNVVSRVRNTFPLTEDITEWAIDRDGSTVFIEWDMIHTSGSVERAQREIKLWFDSGKMKDPNNYRPEGPPDDDGTEIIPYHCPLNEMAIIFINSNAVEDGLVGEIIDTLEDANFTLKGLKYVPEKFSVDGEERAFIAMIWQHTNILLHIEKMMASTDNEICASWIFNGEFQTRLCSEHICYIDSVPTDEAIKTEFEINDVQPWPGYVAHVYE